MIKIISGWCGTSKGMLSASDKAVVLSETEEKRLVKFGVARFVGTGQTEAVENDSFDASEGNCTDNPENASVVNFDAMSIKELLKYAGKKGIDVLRAKKKAEIIEAIMAASEMPDVSGEDAVV